MKSIEKRLILIGLALILSASVASATNRTITNTGDNLTLFITCSNGNYYNATSANLNTAIWSLNATNGGRVHIPTGNYTITVPLKLINNLKLTGDGVNKTILTLGAGVNNHLVIIDGKKNIQISDITFDLNNASQAQPPTYANWSIIYQTNFCKNIMIEHCSFYHGIGSLVYDDQSHPSSNVTVQYCYFQGKQHNWYGGAISFAGWYSTARCNYIANTWATGIRVCGTTPYDPKPQYCTIEDNYITGQIGHGIHLEQAHNCTVNNNYVVSCNSTSYTGAFTRPQGIGGDGTGNYGSGIVADWGNTITNNHVSNEQYRAIGSEGKGIITGNNIQNHQGKVVIQLGPGDVCTDNKINNSQLTGVNLYPKYGIWVYSSGSIFARVVIRGNSMICRAPNRFNTAIYFNAPASDGSLITDNYINRADVGIRISNSSRSIDCTDNVIINTTSIAIYPDGLSSSAISLNQLKNVSKGIGISASNNLTITDNTLNTTSGTDPSAIYESGACGNNSIHDNNVLACRKKTISKVSASTLIYNNIGYLTNDLITYVTCSNGKIYPATQAGLQAALNSLSNTSGWVNGGMNNISISTPIYVGDSGELCRVKLWLATNANCTMLKNYSGAKKGIYIHDVTLEGNGLHQPEWYTVGKWNKYAYGMFFQYVTGLRIENCLVNNTACGGIQLYKCSNYTISYNTIAYSAKLYEDSGNNYANWQCNALYPYNCSNGIITDNHINDPYDCGIVIEGYYNCPVAWREYAVTIGHNTIWGANTGIYSEDSQSCSFVGNTIFDGENTTAFGTSTGFFFSSGSAARQTVTGNTVKDCCYGIEASASTCNISVVGNTISGFIGVTKGIDLLLAAKHWVITGNLLTQCKWGVIESSTADVNIIVANDASGCTNPFVKHGASTVCDDNQGTVS